MQKRLLPCVALGLMIILASTSSALSAPEHWLILKNDKLTVGVDKSLSLAIHDAVGELLWKTMRSSPPAVGVCILKPDGKETALSVALGDAADRTVEDFDDGTYRGRRIRLRGLGGADVEMEIVLALDDQGALMVGVEQVGGKDTVRRVDGLYDWAIKPAADTCVVVPHGSGYLIRSDSPHQIRLQGFVGSAYSLPLFGIIRGERTFYQIIDTWWDAQVSVRHTPGKGTVTSLDWEASLGKLRYPRRVFFHFAEKMDHVGMAKAYRRYLIERKEFTTLAERAERLPSLRRFLGGMEYRWLGWRPDEYNQAMENIRRFQQAGLPVTFFFPKWPARGYVPGRPPDGGWQGFLQPQPVPGGWPAAKQMAATAHKLGCLIKLMVNPNVYFSDAPGYDPAKRTGVGHPAISDRYAEEALGMMLDSLQEKGFQFEALYFDGYSAFDGHAEHKDTVGPVSRRETFEAQTACFRRTRRRGIIPGAELARFWSIPECDFFFFTDWARDRLRHGEPIPLVPLVFHDCYAAHFSGGGYYDEGKHDWYADRHPRLYELMYAAIPSHNWLPGGSRPLRPEDWDTEAMGRRLAWLRRWHAYYQKVCYSEMLTHKFLNPQRTLQRVEFAGGVVADFDLDKGLFRVRGVPGFSGDWEKPEEVTR